MNKKVTYSDIVNALSRKTGFSKQKTEAFVKTLLNQVKDELQESGKASITNFGSFKVKNVAERQGKNPQTGDPITIPAHKRVSFSPYKSLREDVNAEYEHLESELIVEDETSSDENIAETGEKPEAVEKKSAEKSEEASEQEMTEDTLVSGEVESEPKVFVVEDAGTPESTSDEVFDSESEAEITSEEEAVTSNAVDEKEERSSSDSVVTNEEKTKEKNYTNLLASLAVLMLTIIAISSVWLLLDNGSRERQPSQRTVQNSAVVDGQQVAQTGAYRSYEEIKREADALEIRVRQLEQEEQRIRAGVNAIAAQRTSEAQTTDPEETSGASENVTETVGEDTQSTESYQVQEGEWYWAIAKKLYGQPRFWPLLFMENHTVSEDPDSLLKLINIEVPSMEGTADNPTKQDYKDLAAATQMVAQAYENAGKTDKANEYTNIARMWEQMGI